MTEDSITDWLAEFAGTAAQANLPGHMNMISKQVEVLGVPGFEVITWEDWNRQCTEEFPQQLIQSAAYTNLKVKELGPDFAEFVVHESIGLNTGESNENTLEMRLEQEDDKLRLRKLRILSALESVRYMN